MTSPAAELPGTPGNHPRAYRFGPFELQTRTGELRKQGVRVRLRQQSVQILTMLLRHPGELVLREEIRQKLWPANTVVEFDHSINTAIQRLRDVLGDSAETPGYIETLPGRGHRFIAPVEVADRRPVAAPVELPASDCRPAIKGPEPPARNLHRLRTAALSALCLVAAIGWVRPLPSSGTSHYWTFPLGNMTDAVPSPDGNTILLNRPDGLFVRRIDSMSEAPLYSAAPLVDCPVWSPDGSQALFQTSTGLIRTLVPRSAPTTVWPGARITRGYDLRSDGAVLVAVIDPPSAASSSSLPTRNLPRDSISPN